MTHQIKRLSFGNDFPGQTNPLDKVWTHSPSGAAVSRYFLKVVPTQYEFLSGKVVHTNQFSVTQYFKPIDAAAATFVPPNSKPNARAGSSRPGCTRRRCGG